MASFAHGPQAVRLSVAAFSPEVDIDAASWALAAFGVASAVSGALVGAVTTRWPRGDRPVTAR